MDLTITVSDQEAKRVLDLAWIGAKADGPSSAWGGSSASKDDKKLLESFRAECESAKGGKL